MTARADTRADTGGSGGPDERPPGGLRSGAHLLVVEGQRLPGAALQRLVGGTLEDGRRVFVVRFLQGSLTSEDRALLARYPGLLELRVMGRDAPVEPDEREPVDVKWAEDGLALGRRSLHKGGWDVVLLVGVTRAVALGLLDLDRVLELVDERPDATTLLLTGPRAPEELCAAVDSVEDFLESLTT